MHTLALFGIDNGELILMFVVVLLLFGGKKIPELARSFGKGISEFKKGVREVEAEIEHSAQHQTVPPQPAPQQPPVASVATNAQPFRFDPYTGKPVAEEAAPAVPAATVKSE